MDDFELKQIEKEKIEKAEGVIKRKGETNSFFMERDYSKNCKTIKIALLHGYHIWWCSTHHQPLSHCEKDKEKEKTIYKKDIIRRLTPYCCHTSGMHNPKHFEKSSEDICNLQRSDAYDRACKFLNYKPKAIVNPNGCYWCQTEEERDKK